MRRLHAFQRRHEGSRAGVDRERRAVDATELLGAGIDVD